MKYMGSKRRIVKHILPFLMGAKPRVYVEPFVGGANMLQHVKSPVRIGADINKYLIALLNVIKDQPALLPPSNKHFTRDDFLKVRVRPSLYPDWLRGCTDFLYTFGAKPGSTWAFSHGRDYVSEAYRNAQRQSLFFKNTIFIHCDYQNLWVPEGALIYCDPPYKGTTQYSEVPFNHEVFWDWCRNKKERGHTIFISEHEAPSDFKEVWSQEITYTVNKSKRKPTVERLFTL